MIPFFKPGNRTFILSALVLVIALVLQADYSGVFDLVPIVKTALLFVLTIAIPLVPLYIRKAIQNMQKDWEAKATKS